MYLLHEKMSEILAQVGGIYIPVSRHHEAHRRSVNERPEIAALRELRISLQGMRECLHGRRSQTRSSISCCCMCWCGLLAFGHCVCTQIHFAHLIHRW